MTIVTGLQLNSNKKRVTIFIDGVPSLTLDQEIVVQERLRKGKELTSTEIAELQEADLFRQCLDASLDFLSYRPRTEKELKQRLRKRGFNINSIDLAISKLYENNLLDDKAFAQYWKNNREAYNPRSRSKLKHELLQKGVAKDTAEEIVGDVNDEENAYKAGQKKARILKNKPYQEFRTRLYNYLKWRGFGFEAVNRVTERLWKEIEGTSE